jgi:putative ABC transport system substrate-binding protein
MMIGGPTTRSNECYQALKETMKEQTSRKDQMDSICLLQMPRRAFLAITAGGLLAAPLAAGAQQSTKVFRIGILGTYPPTTPEFAHLWEAFFQGLQACGYIEGRNLVVERRFMEGKVERLPELAAELVRLNVSVIVAGGQPPPVAAKHATATIPIVMTNFSDPVGLGLVTSLSRPGGNITGLAFLTVELVGKQLQLLKEAVPRVSRVGLLTNPSNPGAALQRRGAETTARSLGLQIQVLEVQRPDELAGAFAAMTSDHAGAVLLPGDSLFFHHGTQIADLALKSRLPALFTPREFAEAGGLLAYGADLGDVYRRAAVYVDKILKGARPGDLPIEQPTKFELVINLKTAKALGLTIPQSLLQRADQVIE